MEERIPQRQEVRDPAADSAAVTAESGLPSPVKERVLFGDGDDAAAVLSSGDEADTDEQSDDGELEFEFPFVSRDSPALADELFADGRIRPFYPVFGRGGGGGAAGSGDPAPAAARTRGPLGRLFLEESRARSSSTSSTASTSSSTATDDEAVGQLEGALPESYCLWAPGSGSGAPPPSSSSPRPPRKSSSTGSMARWRRISELVVGRSHSDGKEKFLFLPTPPPPKDADKEDKPKLNKPNPKPATPAIKKASAAAHRVAYGGVAGPRRTFLPYREELVGFFANVNGISRSHPHPF